MQSVDWDNPTKQKRRPQMGKEGRVETRFWVECTHCGYGRPLTRRDAARAEARDTCMRCSRSAAGKVGYRAACDKGLREKTLAAVRAYQEANLSRPEKRVRALLDMLGFVYETQVVLEGRWVIDLVLPGGIAIEVVDEFTHRNRAGRDREVMRRWDGSILFVNAQQIDDLRVLLQSAA